MAVKKEDAFDSQLKNKLQGEHRLKPQLAEKSAALCGATADGVAVGGTR